MIPVVQPIIFQNFNPCAYLPLHSSCSYPFNTQTNTYLQNSINCSNSPIVFSPQPTTQIQQFYFTMGNVQANGASIENGNLNFKIFVDEEINLPNLNTPSDLNTIENLTHEPNLTTPASHFSDRRSYDESNAKKNSHIKKKSQTKNLIKNYGKAILTFIIKNAILRSKVLRQLKINQNKFMEAVYSFRNHIHTISAIRYLWQNHPFAKAFRILSCEYLRKHNLQHIFNSRVFKHSVYLKYQEKLMKSMENPKEFESIKQY